YQSLANKTACWRTRFRPWQRSALGPLALRGLGSFGQAAKSQGLTRAIPAYSKSVVLRVARVALKLCVIAAIWESSRGCNKSGLWLSCKEPLLNPEIWCCLVSGLILCRVML